MLGMGVEINKTGEGGEKPQRTAGLRAGRWVGPANSSSEGGGSWCPGVDPMEEPTDQAGVPPQSCDQRKE